MYGLFSNHLSLYTYLLFTDGYSAACKPSFHSSWVQHLPYLPISPAQGIFESGIAALRMFMHS